MPGERVRSAQPLLIVLVLMAGGPLALWMVGRAVGSAARSLAPRPAQTAVTHSLVVVTGRVLAGIDLDRGTEVHVDQEARRVTGTRSTSWPGSRSRPRPSSSERCGTPRRAPASCSRG